MSVLIFLSTTLRDAVVGYQPAKGISLDLAEGETAVSVAENLRLPMEEIKFVMINGRKQPMETTLKDGDRVAYFPAVGGG